MAVVVAGAVGVSVVVPVQIFPLLALSAEQKLAIWSFTVRGSAKHRAVAGAHMWFSHTGILACAGGEVFRE